MHPDELAMYSDGWVSNNPGAPNIGGMAHSMMGYLDVCERLGINPTRNEGIGLVIHQMQGILLHGTIERRDQAIIEGFRTVTRLLIEACEAVRQRGGGTSDMWKDDRVRSLTLMLHLASRSSVYDTDLAAYGIDSDLCEARHQERQAIGQLIREIKNVSRQYAAVEDTATGIDVRWAMGILSADYGDLADSERLDRQQRIEGIAAGRRAVGFAMVWPETKRGADEVVG